MRPTSIALLCALVAVTGGLVAVFAGVSSSRKRQSDASSGGDGVLVEAGSKHGRHDAGDWGSDGGGDGGGGGD
ncbi:hypothetical protein [Luteimonas sp. 9C]|uniref:hypothetical protein n=1 Tax=Luteimonas sp. 9C TaxID=2653148 RepID=UPI00135BC434|nr:hypothetical protein [Luteimonas sp. 9C]